ncbi:MAG: integrase arm-type DNA-binding domain-containing protein, partial [Pseudomonadales bacterium]|nr:integrase arm-type DNA-binding domain-containing protein [Pseudomonadales bacterium]
MGRKTALLTNTQIHGSMPGEKEYTLANGLGLLLRIKPIGRKTWLFNYQRPQSKRRNNLTLGHYPEVSLKQARDYRAELRALLAIDIDPQEHREEMQSAARVALEQTFEQIAAHWFAVKRTAVTEDYANDIWRSLQLHIFPSLGKLPIDQLRAPEVINAIRYLEKNGRLE